ncbi:MAG TPA: zf-TFIIB domain-containing protein [Tepidisphaeraceae bacterium]|nr:zf-TFIIB domain-containing protein [Tepidisphaeraceae bacterium]
MDPAPQDSQIACCPRCGNEFQITELSPILQCPACGEQFFPPEPPEVPTETTESAEPKPSSEEELSGMRIRQISVMRRAAYRTRSYYIIGLGACLVIAIELCLMIIRSIRDTHLHFRTATLLAFVAYCLFLVGAIAGGFFFARRLIELQQEIRQSLQKEPSAQPDFSTLRDGTQHIRELEQMQKPRQPE